MMSGKSHPVSRQVGQGAADQPAQSQLWPDAPPVADGQSARGAGPEIPGKAVDRKTIQDILLSEGLLAVMGDVGSKACYTFWGAERFCHVPVVRACGSPRIPLRGAPPGLAESSWQPSAVRLAFGDPHL